MIKKFALKLKKKIATTVIIENQFFFLNDYIFKVQLIKPGRHYYKDQMYNMYEE